MLRVGDHVEARVGKEWHPAVVKTCNDALRVVTVALCDPTLGLYSIQHDFMRCKPPR